MHGHSTQYMGEYPNRRSRSREARKKGGWPGQMRCSNMANGGRFKNGKNLGHNLTVTRLVLLPKTRLPTTTGRYIVKYTL